MTKKLDSFQIKVEVKPDVEILITAKDPLNCVMIAGQVIDALIKYDPEVLILP